MIDQNGEHGDAGVPLASYRAVEFDVMLLCLACLDRRIFPLEAVISRLEERGTGGAHTGVKAVAGLVRQPCRNCGGDLFESRPYRP